MPTPSTRLAGLVRRLVALAALGGGIATLGAEAPHDLGFRFTDIAATAGVTARTVFGGARTNRYLVETTGSGVAVFDADGDGWIDVFLVNGATFDGVTPGQAPAGEAPTSHLYRNRRDGTFEDVTLAAGLALAGWGQGACAGDYDNDGDEDLVVTYWGRNRLMRNRGAGVFEDVAAASAIAGTTTRWSTGCAFLDYDRDGRLDLFVARYIDFDLAATPLPESGLCRYKGLAVACGPPGLPGAKNALYHNEGDGRFADVSDAAKITAAGGTYALGVSTLDFDGDGWTDLYVADDSSPSVLYRNNRDGTFTDIGIGAGCAYSQDGRPQAGMGVAVGDYDRDGRVDLFKTNFAGDTSTLYANVAPGLCDDRTYAAGFGRNTRWLGWGVAFADFDLDGLLDLFLVNGHVYPEVEQVKTEAGYRQPKVVYRNRGDGRFDDVSGRLGAPVTVPRASRGAAFADLDNDGDVDVVVNNVHDVPELYRLDRTAPGHWLILRLRGVQSNRSAIGARVTVTTGGVTQTNEVRGGGSYLAQNDLRVHFGLGSAVTVDRLQVRWPNGREETWRDVAADRIVTLSEGSAPSQR